MTVGKNNIYIILKKVAGIILILIGIPGLFLPFLQGILFITLGILLLGGKPALEKTKKIWNKIKKRYKN